MRPPLKNPPSLRMTACLSALIALACSPAPPPTPDTQAVEDTGPLDAGAVDSAGVDSDAASADADGSDITHDASVDSAAGDSGGTADAGDAKTSICAPNGHHCDGQKILDCKADGTPGELVKTCTEAEICAPLASDKDLRGCFTKVCEKDTTICDGTSVKQCNAWGTSFLFTDCKSFLCVDGKCSTELKCKANTKTCDGDKLLACSADGKTETNEKNCGGATACVADAKAGTASCVTKVCTPSVPTCNGELLSSCSGDGTQVLPGGTDCTKTKETCLVVNDVAGCVAPSCGDGKVNGPTDKPATAEECDQGANNGKPGVLCSKTCKKLDDSCLSVADCKALSLPPCSLGWQCVAGKCDAKPSIAEVCDDQNPCTEADQCLDGACVGLPKTCDDGNACTKDTCDPKAKGGCVVTQLSNVPCDDGNLCTVGDSCTSGFCKSGGIVCECTTNKDCAAFDDGNVCTGTLVCTAGACAVDTASLPVCGPGVCIAAAVDEAACTKVNGGWLKATKQCAISTGALAASEAGCEGAGHVWSAADACRVAACDPAVGQCLLTGVFDGTACSDGDACTQNDVCVGGKCGGGAVDCDDANPCTDDSCDTKSGCKHVANTALCSDGNACTGGDACKDGGCVGKNICACTKTADCGKYNAKDDKCAGTWICTTASNTCELDPKTVVKCDPSKGTACEPMLCDKTDGACKAVPLADGATCTDGDVCTPDEACNKGVCAGTAKSCDDGNPCTDDVCHPKLGCISQPNAAPCDDGNPCSKDDACGGGSCKPGKDTCNCGADSDCAGFGTGNKCLGGYKCVKLSGKCMWDPLQSTVCGVGLCSKPSAITEGACLTAGGTWLADSACAKTVCEPTSGQCKQAVATNGLACSDGSPCTLGDTCKDGGCVGSANTCDDKDPCTTDSCDPKVAGGCVAKPMKDGACDDGDLCTVTSACSDGKCVGTQDIVCKDDNPCTKDACQQGKGCIFPASKDPCTDDNTCTVGDLCDGVLGKCLPGAPKNCDDGLTCTDNTCDGKTEQGCVALPNKATCSDSDPCSEGEACDNGACKGGKPKDCADTEVCTKDTCDASVSGGCVHNGQAGPCSDDNLCTEKDACVASKGVCFGVNITCDDENVCTADSCDPKAGCVFKPTQGACGAFAKCVDPGTGLPACALSGTKKVLISEVYVGDPCDPSDDFLELHSSLGAQIDLDGYEVQVRAADSTNSKDWQPVFAFKKGMVVGAGGYLLLARDKAVLAGGITPDHTAPTFALVTDGMQIRVYDKPHTLVHDALAWGAGAKGGEGTPLAVWPAARSMERRASTTSTLLTMRPWGTEWLSGNDADKDDNTADFIERLTPEPQTAKVYEPACGGTCTGGKYCDFKGAGGDACAEDKTCAVGCGPGQTCSQVVASCVVDSASRIVLSEVLVHSTGDASAQFIEIYNAGSKDADISGLQLFVKGNGSAGAGAWGDAVAQVPARTVLPAGHYWLVATKGWAKAHGGVDLVVPTLKLDKLGGSVRLSDPRTDVELDRFGWGKAPNPSGSALVVSEVPADFPMVRKASATSNGLTMAKGGVEELAGNGVDTDSDKDDWLILLEHTAHSLGSGEYAPACGGSCTGGNVCNWVKGAEKCVDPLCNGACSSGAVCNIKTGKCDLKVLISQVAAIGPKVLGVINFETDNEFVELYNPGYAPVDVGGLVLRYLSATQGAKYISPVFPTGKCLSKSNKACQPGEKDCTCQGELLKDCTSDVVCTNLTIAPKGYLLVVPQTHDPALPAEDLLHTTIWQMDSASGAVQLIRTDGAKFFDNTDVSDQVCWGKMKSFSCPGTADQPTFDIATPTCSLIRRPRMCTTAQKVASPQHADHYAGNGYTTGLSKGADWLAYCPREARNSAHPPQKP